MGSLPFSQGHLDLINSITAKVHNVVSADCNKVEEYVIPGHGDFGVLVDSSASQSKDYTRV
jgi:hypothetical protein